MVEQRHVPGQPRHVRGPGDLQAGARRAPAVGLRAGSAQAGGRRLPVERGDGLRCRAADGAARRRARSARARCSGSSPPTTASTTSRSPSSARTCTRSCATSPCSTSSPTTPIARAATACWPASACGRSTTGCASRPTSSCAPSSGSSPATRSRPAQLEAVAMVCRGVPADIAELLAPTEVAAMQRRAAWLTEHGVLPGDESGGRYPWPLV